MTTIKNTDQKVDGPKFRQGWDKIWGSSKKIKLIIAGGRNYMFSREDIEKLDALVGKVSEVISGGCAGADLEGEDWAATHNLPVKHFYADWKEHGKAAGPIRNREMAKYADAVALFPGNRGTESMFLEATKANIKIYDFR